jgi:pSer/pThr/pTyr-binding forkhead associated (FHA) protein
MEPRLLQRAFRRVLLCVFTIALSACHQADNREVEKSLFRVITVKQLPFASFIGWGTAFKIDGTATVVTNHHVIEDATAIVLVYWSGGRFVHTEARVEYADRTRDLALLKAAEPLPGRALPLAMYAPPSGSEVWAFGFPGAADALFGGARGVADFLEKLSKDASMSLPTRTFGTVSGERQRNRVTFIQHQVPISPGSSGGPLMDSCGSVVGINAITATRGASISGAVSSGELITLLQLRGLDANVVRSRCWMSFEPRYIIIYSASIIAAFVLIVIGVIAVRYFAMHGFRWTGGRHLAMARHRAGPTSSKVITITPIPLEGGTEALRRPANVPPRALAKLVPIRGGPPIEVPLKEGRGGFVIGREMDCAIVLDDPTISRRHCRLDFDGKGELRITDLNSGNGTRINMRPVSSGTLKAGDRLGVGALEFRIELYSGAPEAAEGSSRASTWQLAAIDEKGNLTRFVIEGGASKRTWVIGRIDKHADLVIPSPSVSGRHAMLRSSANGGLEIQDLGSSNGTTVDGRRIGREWIAIEASSQLRLGGCEIRLTKSG